MKKLAGCLIGVWVVFLLLNVSPFPKADRLPTHTILSDTKSKYDENFWEDFNVIPLEEDIHRIIERVSLQIEKIGY